MGQRMLTKISMERLFEFSFCRGGNPIVQTWGGSKTTNPMAWVAVVSFWTTLNALNWLEQPQHFVGQLWLDWICLWATLVLCYLPMGNLKAWMIA